MNFDDVTPIVVVSIYCLVEVIKFFWLTEDQEKVIIPVLAVVIGAIMSVCLFIFYPEGVESANIVDAITDGAMSGLAATGCNQLWKQYRRYGGGNNYKNNTSFTSYSEDGGESTTHYSGSSNVDTNVTPDDEANAVG